MNQMLIQDSTPALIMQPNNVTDAIYKYSEIQENVLTEVVNALQESITNDLSELNKLKKQVESNTLIRVYFDSKDVCSRNNKKRVVQQIEKMIGITCKFRYQIEGIEHTSIQGIITGIETRAGYSQIALNINPKVVPFLLHYGKGVGGTLFNRKKALQIRGEYNKRIYKILCARKDRDSYEFSIKRLLETFGLEDTKAAKDNNYIKRRILEPARETIFELNESWYFTYSLVVRKKKPGVRRAKADTIVFKIHQRDISKSSKKEKDKYFYVHSWLKKVFDDKSDRAENVTNQLRDNGDLDKFYKRLSELDDDYSSGKKTKLDLIRLSKFILVHDFKIS
jgi:hypothetical protein